MQKSYENAIVVIAMVQELSPLVTKAKNNPQYYEKDVITKAIALGEYRLIVLDNLKTYYDSCSSGEYFLDMPSIAAEGFQIQQCLDYLVERKKMLD